MNNVLTQMEGRDEQRGGTLFIGHLLLEAHTSIQDMGGSLEVHVHVGTDTLQLKVSAIHSYHFHMKILVF